MSLFRNLPTLVSRLASSGRQDPAHACHLVRYWLCLPRFDWTPDEADPAAAYESRGRVSRESDGRRIFTVAPARWPRPIDDYAVGLVTAKAR
jgi:hypothetical protein